MPVQSHLKVHGKFPEGHIYKAFEKLEYAQDFVQLGKFRMGSLAKYRSMEDDPRNDSGEGQGHAQVPGVVTRAHFDSNDRDYFETTHEYGLKQYHSELGNPIYIFSTSSKEVGLNYLKNRFGEYIVRINQPEELANSINSHLKERTESFAGGVEVGLVRYNRGEVIKEDLQNLERIALSYIQKPSGFSLEYEFRFIVINRDNLNIRKTEEYMEVNLGKGVTHAKIIT